MKKVFVTLFVLFLFALLTRTAAAGDPLQKLGRGTANIVSGWLELYHQMEQTANVNGPIAGVTTGLVKGVGMTVYRTAIGIYETITFPIPAPPNYEPIIYPEYIPLKSSYTNSERTQ